MMKLSSSSSACQGGGNRRRDGFGRSGMIRDHIPRLDSRGVRARFCAMGTPRKTFKPTQKLQRWRVVRLKKTPAAELGTIEAPTAAEAIKRAIEEYRIAPDQQNRLAAYPWP